MDDLPENAARRTSFLQLIWWLAITSTIILIWVLQQGRLRFRGATVWPVLGVLPSIVFHLSDLYDWLTHLFVVNGGTFKLPGPWKCRIMTADPANIEYLLKTRYHNFGKGDAFKETFRDMFGQSVVVDDGESFKRRSVSVGRALSSPSFRDFVAAALPDVMQKNLVPVFSEACESAAIIDLQCVFHRLACFNLCLFGGGVEIESLAPGLTRAPFIEAFEEALQSIMFRILVPPFFWKILRFFNVSFERRLLRATDFVYGFVVRELHSRWWDKNNGGSGATTGWSAACGGTIGGANADRGITGCSAFNSATAGGGATGGAIFGGVGTGGGIAGCAISGSLGTGGGIAGCAISGGGANIAAGFLHYEGQSGRFYSDRRVHELFVNLIFAGKDTITAGLTWLFWLIATHPLVEAQILAEIRGIVEERKSSDDQNRTFSFSFDEIKRMEYLHATVTESLRLYPPIPIELTACEEDDVLPDGTTVEKGAQVLYSIYSSGRLESVWGADCLEFKPERWLKNGRFVRESEFKFLAFNGGIRRCTGREFAYWQMKWAVAAVLVHYRVRIVDKHPVLPKYGLALFMKHGLLATIHPREMSF